MSDQRLRFSRRGFIGGAAGAAASVALLGNVPTVLADAAGGRKGSLDRIEHVVILMQENRSFDHYFGTMRGVRGYGDTTFAPAKQRDGHVPSARPTAHRWRLPVALAHGYEQSGWQTRSGTPRTAGTIRTAPGMAACGISGCPPKRNGRCPTTTSRTIRSSARSHERSHCATTTSARCTVLPRPNRCYLWTGTIDPDGQFGGPCAANPDDYMPVFKWTTYPERLQAARISWQVYANDEVGDDDSDDNGYVGDYGDNPLWLFQGTTIR